MKFLSSIASLLCASCAATTIYRDGKPLVRIEGDCKGLVFQRSSNGAVTLSGDISHSVIIAAHGKAASDILLYTAPVITATGLPSLIH